MRRILITAAIVAGSLSAFAAPNPKPGTGTKFADEFYWRGFLRMGAQVKDGATELKNQSTRIGVDYIKSLNEDSKLRAQFEWAVDLLNGSEFDEQTGDGEFPLTSQGELFSNRLGNIAFESKKYGSIAAGKQWSVYSDVTGVTDMFDVSGGLTLGIYSLQSDGGYLGTGRADKAISYRHSAGPVKVGVQYLTRGKDEVANVGRLERGYAGSLIVEAMKGLSVGVAYNEVNFKMTNTKDVDSRSLVSTIKFQNEMLYAAYGYAYLENAEASSSNISRTTLFKKAQGHELYLQYNLNKKINFYTGFNYLDQDNKDNDYGTEIGLIGMRHALGSGYVGLEAQKDQSKDASGKKKRDNWVTAYVKFSI